MFRERLCILRKRKKLTQRDLAMLTGLSLQTINSYEAGRSEPTVSMARRLSEILECSLEELCG